MAVVFDIEGKEAIAKAMIVQSFMLLLCDAKEPWGFGDAPNYDGTVEEPFGAIKEHYKSYVKEDKNGDIEFNGKRYSSTEDITNMISVSFKLKGSDIEGKTVRQEIVAVDIAQKVEDNSLFQPILNLDLFSMRKILGENISPKNIEVGSSEIISYIMTF
jgi:hypothetical protein